MSVYIGLDIGGTKFLVHSLDEDESEIGRIKAETPNKLDTSINCNSLDLI